MISSVQDYPVSHYFNPDGAQQFFIPKYQREYVWRKEDWESLFTDLEDSPSGHFLGSIICVNSQADTMAGIRLELIDGQQRFTTISLLFCALFEKLKSHPEPDDDLTVELVNLKNRIFIKRTNNWRFEPSEQALNKTDFQMILSTLFPKQVREPIGLRNFGNRRIAKAYAYFVSRLAGLTDQQAVELLERLKSAILVKIEVPSHSDAFVLFETINNRGIPLSAIDIIKNNILAELDKLPGYGIDRAFDEWKNLVGLLPEPAVQERFLRQLYNSFRYLKRVDVKGSPRATKSTLIKIYDTLIHRNSTLLFRELQTRGQLYATLLDREAAEKKWGSKTAEALSDMQKLGAAPAYGFLLWAHHIACARKWDEAELIADLACFLTKWFFWRNLTDVPATRDLDPMFAELVTSMMKRLRSSVIETLEDFVSIVEEILVGRSASQTVCEERLNGDLYLDNYDATRFMLCKLEEVHQTTETKRDLWERKSHRNPVFTVEHILPKTENLGEEWIEMLQKDSSETAETIRARCAHQIGNLTLSGYNSALGKMSFDRKRGRKNDKGDFIGYKNGLYLNNTLDSCEQWDEVAINNRSENLRKEVLTILGMWSAQ